MKARTWPRTPSSIGSLHSAPSSGEGPCVVVVSSMAWSPRRQQPPFWVGSTTGDYAALKPPPRSRQHRTAAPKPPFGSGIALIGWTVWGLGRLGSSGRSWRGSSRAGGESGVRARGGGARDRGGPRGCWRRPCGLRPASGRGAGSAARPRARRRSSRTWPRSGALSGASPTGPMDGRTPPRLSCRSRPDPRHLGARVGRLVRSGHGRPRGRRGAAGRARSRAWRGARRSAARGGSSCARRGTCGRRRPCGARSRAGGAAAQAVALGSAARDGDGAGPAGPGEARPARRRGGSPWSRCSSSSSV